MAKISKKTFNVINNKYTKWTEDIIKNDSITLDVKADLIEIIAESYFTETGEQLPSHLITLLTDWYLSNDLKSKNVDKVSKSEYPILSHHQLKRRTKKHPIIEGETLDFLNQTRGRKTKRVTRDRGV